VRRVGPFDFGMELSRGVIGVMISGRWVGPGEGSLATG
jgi:hypothetical protein